MEIKVGDSFDQIVVISEAFSDGSFSTGVTVTAQIRTKKYNKLISNLECSWVDPETTRFLRLLKIGTTDWPIGDAAVDIQFSIDSSGYILSSETILFTIVRDITSESL